MYKWVVVYLIPLRSLCAGVASGVAFCGAIQGGADRYAGFTMLSSTGVTLAARLMCAAQAGTALCSPSVHARSQRVRTQNVIQLSTKETRGF